jgi:hypothetical protein
MIFGQCCEPPGKGQRPMTETIERRFSAETALLGLELLPGQEATLLEAYAALCEMAALVGEDYPMAAEPAHIYVPPAAKGAAR